MGRPFKVDESKPLTAGTPEKSANLSPRASEEWDRLTRELETAGIQVTVAHRTAMTLASTIAADIADAWDTVQKDGAYVTGKAGIVAHPAAKRLDALRRDYIKVLALLGLRSAVAGEKPGAGDAFDTLIDS